MGPTALLPLRGKEVRARSGLNPQQRVPWVQWQARQPLDHRGRPRDLLSQINLVHSLLKIYFNIVLPSITSSSSFRFPCGFTGQNCVRISHLNMHATCSVHDTKFYGHLMTAVCRKLRPEGRLQLAMLKAGAA
jgi:hypothetical protein